MNNAVMQTFLAHTVEEGKVKLKSNINDISFTFKLY